MTPTDNIPLLKRILCGDKSPLGAIAEFLVGSATTCWCCSFWRGAIWGSIVTALVAWALY